MYSRGDALGVTVEKRYAEVVETNVLWNDTEEALGAEDVSCAYCSDPGPTNKMDLLFGFALPSNAIISDAVIDAKIACSFGEYLAMTLWNGVDSLHLGDLDGAGRPLCEHTVFLGEKDITAFLNTAAKVNALLIRFHQVGGSGGEPWTGRVDACYVQVTYTVPPSELKAQIDGLVTILA